MPDHNDQPDRAARDTDHSVRWEVVWRGHTEMDASLASAALEAEGVMTVSSARVPSGTIFAPNLALRGGDFRISVPLADAPHARQVLQRGGQGMYVVNRNLSDRGLPAPPPVVIVLSTVALIALVLLLFLLLR